MHENIAKRALADQNGINNYTKLLNKILLCFATEQATDQNKIKQTNKTTTTTTTTTKQRKGLPLY